MTGQWRAQGTQAGCTTLQFVFVHHYCNVCSQIFPVPTQVRIIRSSAQSHTHWLSIHNASQSKNYSSENGGHAIRDETQPQFVLHQHDELRRIFRQCQAQSHRPGEMCRPVHSQEMGPVYVGVALSSVSCSSILPLIANGDIIPI